MKKQKRRQKHFVVSWSRMFHNKTGGPGVWEEGGILTAMEKKKKECESDCACEQMALIKLSVTQFETL